MPLALSAPEIITVPPLGCVIACQRFGLDFVSAPSILVTAFATLTPLTANKTAVKTMLKLLNLFITNPFVKEIDKQKLVLIYHFIIAEISFLK